MLELNHFYVKEKTKNKNKLKSKTENKQTEKKELGNFFEGIFLLISWYIERHRKRAIMIEGDYQQIGC